MQFKYLENLKSLDEKDAEILINNSFNYFTTGTQIPEEIKQSSDNKIHFSNLVRFYRSINLNKRLDEEHTLQALKEILKSKANIIPKFYEKINQVYVRYDKKIKFGEFNSSILQREQIVNKDLPSLYYNNLISNIKKFNNLNWRINICISNNISNRVTII
jgi:hypothetical protein